MKNSVLKIAEDSINEENMKLQKVLKQNKLSRNDIQETQSLIDMYIKHKRKIEEKAKQRDSKKRKLLK